MAWLLAHSRTLWLYAMDRLLLATALIAGSVLTHQTHRVSHAHAHLGLATAFICILGFAVEITRFIDWNTSANVGILLTLLLDMVLLPIWLVWLACQLHELSKRGGGYSNSSSTMGGSRGADLPTFELEMQPSPSASALD